MRSLVKNISSKIIFGLIVFFMLSNALLVYKIVQNKKTLDYYLARVNSIQSVELKQIFLNGVELPINLPRQDTSANDICYLAISDIMCSSCVESALNALNEMENTKDFVVLYISPNPRLGKSVQNDYKRITVANVLQRSYFFEAPTFFKLTDYGNMVNILIHDKGTNLRTSKYLKEISN